MLAGLAPPPILGGQGSVFSGNALITAPVIWSTAAGQEALLYNGTTPGHGSVTAYLLAVSWGISTASTVAGAIGIAIGATTAPSTTTAATATGPLYGGAAASLCKFYNVGTVSAAATNFLPLGSVDTGALTTTPGGGNLIHLGGAIVVPPGYFVSLAGSATLSTAVLSAGLVWIEIPND